MEKQFFTVKEVSKLTGLSPHSVRKRVEQGTFKALSRSSKNEKILIYRESVYENRESKNL